MATRSKKQSTVSANQLQRPPAEVLYAEELQRLHDRGDYQVHYSKAPVSLLLTIATKAK